MWRLHHSLELCVKGTNLCIFIKWITSVLLNKGNTIHDMFVIVNLGQLGVRPPVRPPCFCYNSTAHNIEMILYIFGTTIAFSRNMIPIDYEVPMYIFQDPVALSNCMNTLTGWRLGPAPITTLESTIYNGPCTYWEQPLTVVRAWILLNTGYIHIHYF